MYRIWLYWQIRRARRLWPAALALAIPAALLLLPAGAVLRGVGAGLLLLLGKKLL